MLNSWSAFIIFYMLNDLELHKTWTFNIISIFNNFRYSHILSFIVMQKCMAMAPSMLPLEGISKENQPNVEQS